MYVKIFDAGSGKICRKANAAASYLRGGYRHKLDELRESLAVVRRNNAVGLYF